MLKYIIFLTLGFIDVFSFDFTTLDDFSRFDGKPVVALWRGTYFSPTYFETEKDQLDYMSAHRLQVPIYCAAAHKKSSISYTQRLTAVRQKNLNQVVADIQTVFKKLQTSSPITIDRQVFSNRQHAFHQRYSNSTDFINALGKETLPPSYRKYASLLEELPKGNPCLSFSTDSGHAGSYGYGLKDYGHINLIDSLYDDKGHRKTTYMGYLQGILLTDNTSRLTMPYDVVAHHNNGDIKISTHFSNDILSEKEVTFVGKMIGSAVTITLPLELPDFSTSYPGDYRNQFGLTKQKYDKIRGILTDRQTSKEDKQARIDKMLKEIIKPAREDNGLVYKNTLIYKAQGVLDRIFDGFDHFQEGIIGLDGRVYDRGKYA